MLNKLLEKVDEENEIDKLQQLTSFYQETKEKEQNLIISRQVEIEKLKKIRQERKLGYVRQIISITLGIALILVGPYIFLQIDKQFGSFLTSVGFTTLGLSSGIVKSFLNVTIKKNYE